MQAVAKPKAGVHQRGGKRMQLTKFKKNRVFAKGRQPAIGERRAMRKRIVLSNNNALRVDNLPSIDERNLALRSSVGKVHKIPEDTIDQLRKIEAFKSSQTWHMFHSPHVLVRPETVEVCSRMLRAVEARETARIVVAGDKAAGKSMVLLQAMTNAFLNKWIVINIPEGMSTIPWPRIPPATRLTNHPPGQDLTGASTEYGPIPDTSPQQWMQPVFALSLMRSIAAANGAVLETILTTRPYLEWTNPVIEGATLNTLIESAREPDQAWPVFAALWHELFAVAADNDGKPRPPVLLALDGLGAVMRTSAYLAQNMDKIHAHDIALVRMFVDVLSGANPLPNGGAVVAATCRSNCARNASLELALARQLARQGGVDALPERDPWSRKYDARVDEVMEDAGLFVLDVKGIGKVEARALMEYWAASGMLRAKVDESTVSEKWMVGGNGIIGEMERSGLLTLRL